MSSGKPGHKTGKNHSLGMAEKAFRRENFSNYLATFASWQIR